MNNCCIEENCFKVILMLELRSDNKTEIKSFAYDTFHCNISRNYRNLQIYHAIIFYICFVMKQGFMFI